MANQTNLNRLISKWVADNYGGEEANNPSWNIEALSDYLEKEMTIADRLEYLRGEIVAERISYEEIAELQSLADHIDSSDVELLEWAGVPE